LGKAIWLVLVAALIASAVGAAEPPAGVVRDYEARLEEISKEIRDIRKEVEALVNEIAEGEYGRVFIFIEGPAPAVRDAGVSLSLDGKPILSRPLTPAELDVLNRGLPLELFSGRLPAGEHLVSLAPLGAALPSPTSMRAERGRISSWVAKTAGPALEWRLE